MVSDLFLLDTLTAPVLDDERHANTPSFLGSQHGNTFMAVNKA